MESMTACEVSAAHGIAPILPAGFQRPPCSRDVPSIASRDFRQTGLPASGNGQPNRPTVRSLSLPPRCALIDTEQSHMAPPMHAATSAALPVTEMEPGQFHKVLLEEEPSDLELSLV